MRESLYMPARKAGFPEVDPIRYRKNVQAVMKGLKNEEIYENINIIKKQIIYLCFNSSFTM